MTCRGRQTTEFGLVLQAWMASQSDSFINVGNQEELQEALMLVIQLPQRARSPTLLLLQVFTVEEMMPHLQGVNGTVTKNLFLKDKKKKGLWLVSARHDRQVSSST